MAVLEVQTRNVNQLPLRDFAPIERGSQEFGFQMGPACFY